MIDSKILRSKHPVFTYQSFNYKEVGNEIHLQFFYHLAPSFPFVHTLRIGLPDSYRKKDLKQFEAIIFHIGLVDMFSYWKSAISSHIVVEAGNLEQAQIDWITNLLINGMGEFFYRNSIDFTQPNFVSITSQSSHSHSVFSADIPNKYLVPIGGGKDSLVSLKIISEQNFPYACLFINPNPAMKAIETIIQVDSVTVKRILDPELFRLNDQGYLNGHTPFSASIACISLLCGVLFNCNSVLVSNERSSNEGNALYKNHDINHQYSKTFAFEKTFNTYAKSYLSKNSSYISFLRPLYELQISRIFSEFHEYFSTFKSCNIGRGKEWCGNCSKCLFVYLSLFPFVADNQLLTIFSKDLLSDTKLIPTLDALVGKTDVKPFECVGTREEVVVSLYLAIEKNRKKQSDLLPLLYYAKHTLLVGQVDLEKRSETLLRSWNQEHNLSEKLTTVLKEYSHNEIT